MARSGGSRRRMAYEVRGMVSRVTSFDSPTVGSGSRFKRLQSHSGAVNPSTTASVQMGYANGSGNTIRPTSIRRWIQTICDGECNQSANAYEASRCQFARGCESHNGRETRPNDEQSG
jgi:hypothetical protein